MSIRSWIQWSGEELLGKFLSKFLFVPASSCALVITDDGRVVGVKSGGYYMLPGGIVDAGESFEEAAIREVKEETGVDVKIVERLQENSRPNLGVEVVFLAVRTGGEFKGSKEGEPRLLTPEQAFERKWRHDRDIEDLINMAVSTRKEIEQENERRKREKQEEPEILGVEDPY